MSEGVERSILNRDIEDALSETDIRNRPLNGEFSEESFHLFSIEVESDDSWIHPPPDGNREQVVFRQGFAKKVNGDWMFLLDQFPKKKFFFGRRKWRGPSPERVPLGIIDFDRSDLVLASEGLEVRKIQRFFSVGLIRPVDSLQKVFGNGILQAQKES